MYFSKFLIDMFNSVVTELSSAGPCKMPYAERYHMSRCFLIRTFRYTLLLILSAQISGCAIVDQYGSRATSYNSQATEFKSSVILLNIMRAAYREPLQFTDLSTIVGSASVNTSLQGQLPIRIGGPPPTAPQFLNLTPNVQFSGGPTFTTNNLNTQEFYQGIQTSIPAQTVANYLRAGGDPNLILPLVISSIELDTKPRRTTFYNTGEVGSHSNFLEALHTLIELGLTVEEEQKDDDVLSPKLTIYEARDPRLLAGVVQANAAADAKTIKVKEATTIAVVNGKKKEVSLGYFEVVKPAGKSAKFCFRRKYIDRNRSEGYSQSDSKWTKEEYPLKGLSVLSGREADQIHYNPNSCLAPKKKDTGPSNRVEVGTGITLRIRSVQEIIYFLGGMVRHQVLTAGEAPNYLNPSGLGPAYLFKVEERRPQSDEIYAALHDRYYAIRIDPSGQDASTQVIQFLTEAWALQLSSKSLPASNVITVAP